MAQLKTKSGSAAYRDAQVEAVIAFLGYRFDTLRDAEHWVRCTPLPGYGDLTAADLVAEGRITEVGEVIEAIDAGVHA